ncbi:MAG: hypothetical protein ACREDP_23950 [Bradyrhizobium sp.]
MADKAGLPAAADTSLSSSLFVYNGRYMIGRIGEGDGGCRAFNAAGAPLGTFANRRLATSSIIAASCASK